jgi:hypothetical protein
MVVACVLSSGTHAGTSEEPSIVVQRIKRSSTIPEFDRRIVELVGGASPSRPRPTTPGVELRPRRRLRWVDEATFRRGDDSTPKRGVPEATFRRRTTVVGPTPGARRSDRGSVWRDDRRRGSVGARPIRVSVRRSDPAHADYSSVSVRAYDPVVCSMPCTLR